MAPHLHFELELFHQGHTYVAGLDEVGRGAWAGPVVAAAVVLPLHVPHLARVLEGVDDSKVLTADLRADLVPPIRRTALAWGVGQADPLTVDAIGIVPATRLAMRRALWVLDHPVSCLLLDAIELGGLPHPQRALVDADASCLSVAAASILAKVHRDALMMELDDRYPGYGFRHHKGYGTPQHRVALARLGPSAIHRLSWAPLQAAAAADGAEGREDQRLPVSGPG